MNATQWKFYHPRFEYKDYFNDYNIRWLGHTHFAYDLVRNTKPAVIVELGTFKGTSLYSFSQAVKDGELETEVYPVDSWEGEEQTGLYGEDVFQLVRKVLRDYYIGLNVRMMRMYFDEASKEFKSKTIDILHIDGLHTYEAVKHDYDTWKDKVKEDGIILFHDIKVADFGVWKVWEDVKKEHPKAVFLEFKNNAGLGVLLKSPKFKEIFPNQEAVDDFERYYAEKAETLTQMQEKLAHAQEHAAHVKAQLHNITNRRSYKLFRLCMRALGRKF